MRTLNGAERLAVCRWSTDTQGGPGKAYTCGGGVTLTVDTVDGCVQWLAASAICTFTVAQIEACTSELRDTPCANGGKTCAALLTCDDPASPGPDAGSPPTPPGLPAKCVGMATACETAPDCKTQRGCAVIQGSCVGTPIECGAIGYDISCFNQPGCRWSFDSRFFYSEVERCEGRAEDSCEPQCVSCLTGCRYTAGPCTGTPSACDTISAMEPCVAQSGCQWR